MNTFFSHSRSSLRHVSSFVAVALLASCTSSGPADGTGGSAGDQGQSGGAGGAGTNGGGTAGTGTGGAAGTTGGTTPSGGAGAIGGSAGSATGGAAGSAAGTQAGGAGSGGVAGSAGTSGGSASGGTASGGTMNQGGSANAGASGAESGGTSAGDAGTGAGGTSGEPTFRVFLLLGQSNMAGYAKAQAADKVEDPRVRVLGFDACAETGRETDVWDTAAPPLHECWNSAVGPGDHFAKTLLATLPPDDTIGLVPCAISGERIETFLKAGGTRYTWILERAELAQEAGGVIQGILFHQGESNNGDSSWPGKVNTLVTDLRNDLGLGDVPFLAGELVGNGASHNAQVARIPELVANGHVISAAGLVVDPADTQWNLHFDHDSTVTLGQRYAEKMIELLGL